MQPAKKSQNIISVSNELQALQMVTAPLTFVVRVFRSSVTPRIGGWSVAKTEPAKRARAGSDRP
jgi:hypothetical protein